MKYKKSILILLIITLVTIILVRTEYIFLLKIFISPLKIIFKTINNIYGIGILILLILYFSYIILKKITFNSKIYFKKVITTSSVINSLVITFIPTLTIILKYLKIEKNQVSKIKNILNLDYIDTLTFFIIILVSIFYLYQFLFLKKIEIDTIECKKIEILHGEIKFEEIPMESVLIIPANTNFDTVFEGVINERTMHGRAITYLTNLNINVEQEVKNKLQYKTELVKNNRINNKARREKYNFGECIELPNNIIFSAFGELDENDRAQIMNLSEYTIRMLKIFNKVDKIKNNRNVIIPFFGTGNINMCTQGNSYQNILENLVDIILKSELNFSNNTRIKIVLYKLENKISLYELKNKFKV